MRKLSLTIGDKAEGSINEIKETYGITSDTALVKHSLKILNTLSKLMSKEGYIIVQANNKSYKINMLDQR